MFALEFRGRWSCQTQKQHSIQAIVVKDLGDDVSSGAFGRLEPVLAWHDCCGLPVGMVGGRNELECWLSLCLGCKAPWTKIC
eukprot:4207441-Amphidinium_carterae.1